MSSPHLKPLASIDAEVADRLEHDDAFRRRYIRFWAQTEVASELRALRKTRKLTQAEVADLAKTGQSAISRIEKADYDGWSYKTLIGIAEELRARLRITFEPLEKVISEYRTSSQNDAATADVFDEVDPTGSAADVEPGEDAAAWECGHG